MNVKADDIRKVAEWANFEKTPLWYLRVGYNVGDIILDDSLNDLREYKSALELKPDYGLAHFALGAAYAEREEYDLAISEMNMSRSCKIDDDHDLRAAVFIADYQNSRSDAPEATDEALKTLDETLQKYQMNFLATLNYIQIAAPAGRGRKAMMQIRKLGTRLPDFLISMSHLGTEVFHTPLRKIAQQAKGVGLLKKAYEKAIEKSIASNKSATVGLLDALAILYIENQEEDQAIEKYQTLLQIADGYDDSMLEPRAKEAELYFRGAYSNEASEEERAEDLDKLIKMESENRSRYTGTVLIPNIDVGNLLALYYRLVGPDNKAHPLFRDRLELGVSLLEDNDADNNYQAWEILARTFLKAGEKDNAVAAISVWDFELRKQLEKLGGDGEDDKMDTSDTEPATEPKKEEQSPETEVSKAPEGDPSPDIIETPVNVNVKTTLAPIRRLDKSSSRQIISASMLAIAEPVAPKPDTKLAPSPIRRLPKSSAPKTALASIPAPAEPVDLYPDTPWTLGVSDCCNKSFADNKTGIWICLICRDMAFCPDCFKKHQEGALPYIMCDPDHEFVLGYGYPENLPQKRIKVGGKILDRGEWLDSIRKKWRFKDKEREDIEVEKVNGMVLKKERFLEKVRVKSE